MFRTLFAKASSAKASPAILDAIGKCADDNGERYGLTKSRARYADLIAQTANETGGYVRFEENLNYGAEALCSQWPKHFTPELAEACARRPSKIAEHAYGGRMGNVNPGDGWLYRGRGMLQLTGRAAYALYGKRLGLPLEEHPEQAADPAVSLLVAMEFYTVAGVWKAIDAGDLSRARKLTNGGLIGFDNVNRLRALVLG